ncbi:DUF4145 domain-containing protein [Cupriavidus sp. TMH.W2]|uniref:DUF4145 domain-containing protein n=1 Tax=Cupriavidus sp. TMH.W2 TaxID=3434465 RepID=UPI003D76F079
MHPEHFQIYHTREDLPHWRCTRSACAAGTLQLVADSLRTEADYESQRRMQTPDYGFTAGDDTGRYTMTLQCRHCGDRVMAIGAYGPEEWEIEGTEHTVEVFYPKYFVPPVPLIALTPACPAPVRAALDPAFATYWSAPGLAANAIRVALERLMDAQQMPASGSLHDRLVAFGKQQPGVADFLMAAKWVGNAGSHAGVADHKDIRDILAMIELALTTLYPPDHAALAAKAAKYIQNKGRPG